MKILIIGTGQGAFQLAVSLRQDGFDGQITLLGDEPGLPYQRPPLSKAYLKDGRADKLLLRPADYFERNGINIVDNVRVTHIDRLKKLVETRSTITIDSKNNNKNYHYDHLIIATGARNNPPPISGLDTNNVVALRTLADATLIREILLNKQHVVVIGGGFIGLEFASVARSFGIKVSVIEAANRLMARAVSSEMSDYFLKAHQADGVTVELGVLAKAIIVDEHRSATGVELADGRKINGDLVLVAAGVVPNTELATEAGLTVENGIVANEYLLTSDEHISTLGDVANFPMPNGRRVRLESVQAATDHARTISKRLTEKAILPYKNTPWFWSDQGKLKLQIAGLTDTSDHYVNKELGDLKKAVYCFKDDQFLGVETVNAPAVHMAARKLLALNKNMTLNDFITTDFDLKALLK